MDPVHNNSISFPNILMLNWICCYKECTFSTIKPFRAYQIDVIKKFAVVTSAVIKRGDCTIFLLNTQRHKPASSYGWTVRD